jgi:hypothetical protein
MLRINPPEASKNCEMSVAAMFFRPQQVVTAQSGFIGVRDGTKAKSDMQKGRKKHLLSLLW